MSRRAFSSPFFKQVRCSNPGEYEMSGPEIYSLGEDIVSGRPNIKVIGVGGAGCNAIAESPFEKIAVCTALEDTRYLRLESKILINPEHIEFMKDTTFRTVRSIKFELKDCMENAIGDPDIVFIFAGLGGDTGSYIAPVVADVCNKKAGLCISNMALPFSVEGRDRRCVADCAITKVCLASDITITYPNDHLLKMVPNLPLGKAFNVMNRIMMVPLQELEKVLTVRDLEPVRKCFQYSKCSRLGMGTSAGEYAEIRALEEALTSPWFDFSRDRVMSALVTISSADVEEQAISNVLDDLSKRIPYARICYASYSDHSLGEKYKVTLVLGFS